MRHLFALPLAFIVSHASAQPFNWQWSVSATSSVSIPDVLGVATNADGNSYVAGQFYGTATRLVITR